MKRHWPKVLSKNLMYLQEVDCYTREVKLVRYKN